VHYKHFLLLVHMTLVNWPYLGMLHSEIDYRAEAQLHLISLKLSQVHNYNDYISFCVYFQVDIMVAVIWPHYRFVDSISFNCSKEVIVTAFCGTIVSSIVLIVTFLNADSFSCCSTRLSQTGQLSRHRVGSGFNCIIIMFFPLYYQSLCSLTLNSYNSEKRKYSGK